VLLAALTAVASLPVLVGARVHRFGQQRQRQVPGPLPAVVLGARVWPDGRASDALVDRVRVGVALLRSGQASSLVFSGGSPDGRPTEASVMRQLALGEGVDDAACVLEPESRSTFDNARRCAQLLSTREVLLVTCDFHLLRATAHFRRAGFTVHPVPSRRALTTAQRLTVTGRELLALARRPWLAL
jgi:uncharacterized SAM-binding protein YcdF (DUF218 family)